MEKDDDPRVWRIDHLLVLGLGDGHQIAVHVLLRFGLQLGDPLPPAHCKDVGKKDVEPISANIDVEIKARSGEDQSRTVMEMGINEHL